jgi:putative endonuclease
MKRGGVVYILSNKSRSTLYTGVTSDLPKRIVSHRNKLFPDSFTAKYNVNQLVYYERFQFIEEAIRREKQIKASSRKKKIQLINSPNPGWKDLYDEVMRW